MSDQFYEEENWLDDTGGLPSYLRRIVKHLEKAHPEWDKGRQIATAVSAARRICGSGDTSLPGIQNVNTKSRAEACAAVASWEEKKARAKADNAVHPSPTVSLPMSEKFDAEPETDATVHSYGEPIGDVEHGIAQWAREWLADHPVEAQRLKDLTTG